MSMTLNQLIDKLVAIRDAEPALGAKNVEMIDQELGKDFSSAIRDVEVDREVDGLTVITLV